MKNKSLLFYTTSLLAIFIVAVVVLITSYMPYITVLSTDGKLNLSSLGDDTVIAVSGTWEFYPNMLYTDVVTALGATDLSSLPNHSGSGVPPLEYRSVPDAWPAAAEYNNKSFGYGTYRIRLVRLDPEKYYGISINQVASSYRLWVNNQLRMECGKIGTTKGEYIPAMHSKLAGFRSDANGNATIFIEVSNFDYVVGGLEESPLIGNFELIYTFSESRITSDTFLFAGTFFLGLILLALYAKIKIEKTALYTGIFSLLVSLRIICTDYRIVLNAFPFLPWQLVHRIGYLSGYLLLPLAGLAIYSLRYVKQRPWLRNVYYSWVIASIFFVFATPATVYPLFLHVYKYLFLIFTLYFIYVLIYGILNDKPGAIPISIGVLFITIATILELFSTASSLLVSVATFILIASFVLVQMVKLELTREEKERLESEIILDRLTGVYNRLYLDNLVRNNYFPEKPKHSWYVFFADVNNFKYINDTFGHAVGDVVLKYVAQSLKNSMREEDMIFRYGGDEFIILSALENAKNPQDIIDRINRRLSEPIETQGHKLHITLSIGIALFRSEEEKLDEAILRSDHEMYRIKHQFHSQNIFLNAK